jgi:uncharacterized membrane protein YdbT with pleckstrin-like domain
MFKESLHILRESPNTFEGQKEGERVIMLLRKHYFVILLHTSFLFLAGLAPIVLGIYLWEYVSDNNLQELFYFVSSLWYLGIWISLFHFLTMYTLNTVIITDHRIIDSDQHGMFNRKISELHSHRIQDVSAHTNGVFETLLGFGDVVVQTAASETHFIFHKMPDPNKIKDTIMHITGSKHSGVIPGDAKMDMG